MELVAQPLPSKNTEKDTMGEINKNQIQYSVCSNGR